MYTNLWSANSAVTTANDNAVVKTIYDPSPVGYHLPASNAFTGFTYNGDFVSGSYFGTRYNSPYASQNDITANGGWIFYCNKMNGAGNYDPAGGTIFFPVSGARSGVRGTLISVGSYGQCWTAGMMDLSNSYLMRCYITGAIPLSTAACHYAFSVRPVRE